MTPNEKKIKKLLNIPGVLNWARQNFPRRDDTRIALERLVASDLQISLNPIYSLCARIAYREVSYDAAFDKAAAYQGKFHRDAGTQIIPLFQEFLTKNQYEGVKDFRKLRIPFPIGKNPEGKVASVPVRPTFVTIRQGRLHPVFLLGWIDSPLTPHQVRLICAVIRRALLTQQDFLGCDAEIVTFSRGKGGGSRYLGGWLVSAYPDLTDAELARQVEVYNDALVEVLTKLRRTD